MLIPTAATRTAPRTGARHLRQRLPRPDRRDRPSSSTGPMRWPSSGAPRTAPTRLSEAGTVVIAQYLMGGSSATGAVGTCPDDAAGPVGPRGLQGGLRHQRRPTTSRSTRRQYTDFKGDVLGAVGAGTMPAGAQGVQAFARRASSTRTSRARSASSPSLRRRRRPRSPGTDHDAVRRGIACGLFPITVPYVVSTCDNTGKLSPGVGPWPFLGNAQTRRRQRGDRAAVQGQERRHRRRIGRLGRLARPSTAHRRDDDGPARTSSRTRSWTRASPSLPFQTWIQTFTGGVGKGGPEIQDASTPTTTTSSRSRCSTGPARRSRPGTACSTAPPAISASATTPGTTSRPSRASSRLLLHQRQRPQGM